MPFFLKLGQARLQVSHLLGHVTFHLQTHRVLVAIQQAHEVVLLTVARLEHLPRLLRVCGQLGLPRLVLLDTQRLHRLHRSRLCRVRMGQASGEVADARARLLELAADAVLRVAQLLRADLRKPRFLHLHLVQEIILFLLPQGNLLQQFLLLSLELPHQHALACGKVVAQFIFFARGLRNAGALLRLGVHSHGHAEALLLRLLALLQVFQVFLKKGLFFLKAGIQKVDFSLFRLKLLLMLLQQELVAHRLLRCRNFNVQVNALDLFFLLPHLQAHLCKLAVRDEANFAFLKLCDVRRPIHVFAERLPYLLLFCLNAVKDFLPLLDLEVEVLLVPLALLLGQPSGVLEFPIPFFLQVPFSELELLLHVLRLALARLDGLLQNSELHAVLFHQLCLLHLKPTPHGLLLALEPGQQLRDVLVLQRQLLLQQRHLV
mmetsp:Transcript_29706/g.74702  ORF Transcript_29706/g.74702 Transcript_29706/m.74702 type:complete len:432 (-) Transcript_29706:458-1753(-)